MKIYTRKEIFTALRKNVSSIITDGHLLSIIDLATNDAYFYNRTHDFKEIMRVVYEYYKDPNFKELEEQLDRIYECDVPSLEFEQEDFTI